MNSSSSTSSAQNSVVVFGFPPYLYMDVVQHFTSFGEAVSMDPPPAVDSGRNWITITYRNSWEAARAVRSNGEILAIGREECMIGVKYAVRPPVHTQCLYRTGFTMLTYLPIKHLGIQHDERLAWLTYRRHPISSLSSRPFPFSSRRQCHHWPSSNTRSLQIRIQAT